VFRRWTPDVPSVAALAVAADCNCHGPPCGAVPFTAGRQRMRNFVKDGVSHFNLVVELYEIAGQGYLLSSVIAFTESNLRTIEYKCPFALQSVPFHQSHRQFLSLLQIHIDSKLLSVLKSHDPMTRKGLVQIPAPGDVAMNVSFAHQRGYRQD
jgi:hypothetical protein